jgi:hypothetical protein
MTRLLLRRVRSSHKPEAQAKDPSLALQACVSSFLAEVKSLLAVGFFLLGFLHPAAGADGPAKPQPLVRNLVTDYGAGAQTSEISDLVQKAVDEVGAAGGGTVVIPGRAAPWYFARPVLVGHPNVTIAGDGSGTRLFGCDVLFVLGLKSQYKEPIGPGHYVPLSGAAGILDNSVREPHFGLRTFDGKTPVSGLFPTSPLTFANNVPRDPSGDTWKDYARGTGKPTYWAHHPQYTINLAIVNNTQSPMKGTLCGVGPGGLTPATTHGNIADPLNIWTIESDPATGKDLSFKFRVVDATGQETIRTLSLSPSGAGQGAHRISVQLDFTTGRCRAWFSTSDSLIRQPLLAGQLDLPTGCHLKAFEYGAFRLGSVIGSPFAGSPSQGGAEGDWTCAGLSLFETLRYSLEGDRDRLGAVQEAIDPKAKANDAYRLFPESNEPGLVVFLPLKSKQLRTLVAMQGSSAFGNRIRYGYWLPTRTPAPLEGTLTVRDLQMFGGIAIGEAQHVRIENIYQGGGGYYHGIGTFGGGPNSGLLEIRNCRLIGHDAAIYNHGMTIQASNVSGGGGELLFRFVGVRGCVDNVMITSFVAADYYVKLHAGAVGGPLRFSQFCSDNEGLSYVPRKACFYAEPSLDGGKDGNRLVLRGSVYTGSLLGQPAVIELAAPTTVGADKVSAYLDVDGIDLSPDKGKIDSVVLCRGPCWSGRVLAQNSWAAHTEHGLVHYTGPGQCGIVTVQEADALPKVGAWLSGCHLIRIPDRLDPATGAWVFKTYRCVGSGVCGTKNEPQWQQVKDK